MITAEFFIDCSRKFLGFDIKGHSGYSQCGEDIVCAAVSSAAFMTANTLTEILKLTPKIKFSDNGHMSVKLSKSQSDNAQSILEGFSLHMKALTEQYKNNIHIIYTEV